MILLTTGASPAGFAQARNFTTITPSQVSSQKVYLPMTTRSAAATPPPTGSLPAALVGTWFSGDMPPSDFYDPTTGRWRDTNGLGQMYSFTADGTYTYAGFLRLQNGQCRTEVSTYKQGTAQSANETVTLAPRIAKTRTVAICGSRSDTTTDGPFDPMTIGWQVQYDNFGHLILTARDGAQTTEYYKEGMPEVLIGGWSLNGVASTNFYNPSTREWATPAKDGAWFRFSPDSTYRFGEYGHGQDAKGCATTYWIYQEGTVQISGGRLSYQARSGRGRIENACTPGTVSDEPYVDPKLYEFTWEVRDRTTAPKLAVSPLGQFRFIEFTKE